VTQLPTHGSDRLLERMQTLHPKLIDLTLDRVWNLLAATGNPQNVLPPVIHIAGTNGKGSTLAMIRAGLEGIDDTCHAYTSPHLVRFHERIRLAGDLIDEDALITLLDDCLAANGETPITYFEITTVAALMAFGRTKADWTLLEVGLGGRLDATNVVDKPAATVITPIDYDHQQFLGDTMEQIAGEKAGIIKRGVPCVVGRQNDATLEVIENRAMRLGAPLQVYGQHWHVYTERDRLIFQDERGLLDLPLPTLAGPHQIENAGTALATLRLLGRPELACEAAMTDASWAARMQRLHKGPLVEAAPECELWLDGGHNPAGARAIFATLNGLSSRPTHLVCGMLNTKDIEGYLRPLSNIAGSLTAVSIPDAAATIPASETAKQARAVGMNATEAASVQQAVETIAFSHPGARILICGSLYLAGDVLRDNG
jgi:dihydrofolate synthase / folylpolyglutamate synthase